MKLNLESVEEKIQHPKEWLKLVISINSKINAKIKTDFLWVSAFNLFQRIIKDEI